MEMKRCDSCFREYEGAVCPHCGGAQNAPHQLQPGTLLQGRYKLGRVLGQGGFGITYLGWDTLMNMTVAVKEFYPTGTVFRRTELSRNVRCDNEAMEPHFEYSKERFLREANALVRFKDIPEVVDILDLVKENNTTYIVMEYVRGVDLAKYIQMKGGRLGVDETFRILKPVMEALAKVHRGGIVHRDISPDNIILDPMGGAKLLDFGAVRAVEDPDVDKGLNKSTEAILKQGFAPIEQYNTRGSLGPWTDEYAMCATVWYCLTGKVPVEASIRVSEGIDPDWGSIPGLPMHQQKALEKGFSCRAKDRYRSLDELLADLFPTAADRVPVSLPYPAETPPFSAPSTTKKLPGQEESAKKRKKPGTVGWVLGAVAVLTILFAVAGAIFSPANAYRRAEKLLAENRLGEAAIAFGKISGYSDARERSLAIWETITPKDTISAGNVHSVGLRTDGTAVAAGYPEGECDISGWYDLVEISAGGEYTAGLKRNGTVVAVGRSHTTWLDVSDWTNIVAISAGHNHLVGLKDDGTVVAVGDNGFGQCDVDKWSDIVAISAGEQYTLGLKIDGTVVAVGVDSHRQLQVGGWSNIVAIDAGSCLSLGLRADGTVVAAGSQYTANGPYDVSGWSDIVAVSAGSDHAVGLRADGTVVAVGDDFHGVCDVSGWADIVAISAGWDHTLGLRSDGTVVAVGYDEDGVCDVDSWSEIRQPQDTVPAEIGVRPMAPGEEEAYALAEALLAEGRLAEAAIAFGKLAGAADARARSLEIWDMIAAREVITGGDEHSAGVRADGTAVAMSRNSLGECDVNGWSDIVAVSSGTSYTVGLRADGTAVATGVNEAGKCDVGEWTDIVAISAGHLHTAGLKADGTVVAVGDNGSGCCDVDDWSDIVAIGAGEQFTVGLRSDGTVVAVGSNFNGQLQVDDWSNIVAIDAGLGLTVGLKADGTVVATGDGWYDVSGWSDIVAVSAGSGHIVGLRADGTVVAVGDDSRGQCDVSGWSDIVAVSAGWYHTLGLRSDGTVAAVGRNYNGQCNVDSWTDIRLPMVPAPITGGTQPTESEETEAPRTEPMSPEEEAYLYAETLLSEGKLGEAAIAFGKLAGFSDAGERSLAIWDKIAVRDTVCTSIHHVAGIKTNGTVVAVGDNYDGQCVVSGWSDIVAVSSGETHTVGLRADGTVVAAVTNYQGQCNVSDWSDIVAISAGKYHTIGLRIDGTVVITSSSYGDVSGWTDIVAISAGQGFNVGLRADGAVVAVGENQYGQCNVSGWSDIVAIRTSYFHTVGLRADGTVVAAGNRSDGQCNVENWTGIVAIGAGEFHTVGLRADGAVVTVGGNYQGQCNVVDWTNMVAISAGGSITMGLQSDGTVVNTRSYLSNLLSGSNWTDIRLPKERVPFR